jgi:hypothetical protein
MKRLCDQILLDYISINADQRRDRLMKKMHRTFWFTLATWVMCPLASAGVMTGTLNTDTNEIELFGSISADLKIQLNITNLSPGDYIVTKHEQNLTDDSWYAWDMVFGDPILFDQTGERTTEHNPAILSNSNFFNQSTATFARNALTFHDGVVNPGETLIKTFGITHNSGIAVFLHHERYLFGEPTSEEIEDGFGVNPLDPPDVIIDLELTIIPEPAALSVLSIGGFIMVRRRRKLPTS